MPRGYDRPLYIQPFDHRGSFQTKMFGWQSPLSDAQTAEIGGAKRVIYDGFLAALAGRVRIWRGFRAPYRSVRSDLLQSAGALQSGGRWRVEQTASGQLETPVRFSRRARPQPLHVRA